MRFSIITFVAAFAGVVMGQAKVSQIPDGQVQAPKTSAAATTAKTSAAVSTAKTSAVVSTAKTSAVVSTAKASTSAAKTTSAAPAKFTGGANVHHIMAREAALPFLAGVAYLLA